MGSASGARAVGHTCAGRQPATTAAHIPRRPSRERWDLIYTLLTHGEAVGETPDDPMFEAINWTPGRALGRVQPRLEDFGALEVPTASCNRDSRKVYRHGFGLP